MSVNRITTAPLGPEVLQFWRKLYMEHGQPRTLIARVMLGNGPCHRCPAGSCKRYASTCVVEAAGHVPPDECAEYVLVVGPDGRNVQAKGGKL